MNSCREVTRLLRCHRFEEAPFSNWFLSTLKRKASVFKFFRVDERFRKAPFSWRISVNGRRNHRKKAAFSNFSGVVWKKPKYQLILKPLQGSVKLHGITNLKLYTRRIVASPGSQMDVSAPNWDQVYKTRVKTGQNGEDGKHGLDGPKG